MKGSVPARIVASGLRLVNVERRDINGYTGPEEWVQFQFTGPNTTIPDWPVKHAILYDTYGGIAWDVYCKPGSALHKRTYYWERMILKLQQLL